MDFMSDASSSDAQSSDGSGSPDSTPEGPQPDIPANYDKALELLRMQGASAEAAERALKATAEHQPSNATRWADEAAMWLACTNEVSMESEAMGHAMQESLVEAEAQKKLEKPVHEQDRDQLKLRYDSSRIMKQIQRHRPISITRLWEPPNRFHLIELLELEANACKWYPRSGTKAYMEQLGQACAQQLSELDSGQSFAVGNLQRNGSLANGGAASILQEQVNKLQTILYAMPEISGAAPKAFMDLEDPDDEEGIDEVLERPAKRQCSTSQVDLA